MKNKTKRKILNHNFKNKTKRKILNHNFKNKTKRKIRNRIINIFNNANYVNGGNNSNYYFIFEKQRYKLNIHSNILSAIQNSYGEFNIYENYKIELSDTIKNTITNIINEKIDEYQFIELNKLNNIIRSKKLKLENIEHWYKNILIGTVNSIDKKKTIRILELKITNYVYNTKNKNNYIVGEIHYDDKTKKIILDKCNIIINIYKNLEKLYITCISNSIEHLGLYKDINIYNFNLSGDIIIKIGTIDYYGEDINKSLSTFNGSYKISEIKNNKKSDYDITVYRKEGKFTIKETQQEYTGFWNDDDIFYKGRINIDKNIIIEITEDKNYFISIKNREFIIMNIDYIDDCIKTNKNIILDNLKYIGFITEDNSYYGECIIKEELRIRHGKGVILYKDNTIFQGEFENGKIIKGYNGTIDTLDNILNKSNFIEFINRMIILLDPKKKNRIESHILEEIDNFINEKMIYNGLFNNEKPYIKLIKYNSKDLYYYGDYIIENNRVNEQTNEINTNSTIVNDYIEKYKPILTHTNNERNILFLYGLEKIIYYGDCPICFNLDYLHIINHNEQNPSEIEIPKFHCICNYCYNQMCPNEKCRCPTCRVDIDKCDNKCPTMIIKNYDNPTLYYYKCLLFQNLLSKIK